jgi:hypothetical protein
MTTLVVSSDSDVDLSPVLEHQANLEEGVHGVLVPAAGPGFRSLSHPSLTDKEDPPPDGDPDWVTEFTPTRRTKRRGSRARRDGNTEATHDGAGMGTLPISGDNEDTDDGSDSILDLSTGMTAVNDMTQPETLVAANLEEAQAGLAEQQKSVTQPAKLKSTLPLTAAPKFDQNLILVQAESEAFDLSGDVGAVGRVKADHTGVYLDVKGALYSCGMQAINTVCVVTVGDDEARITAVLNEAISLRHDQSQFKSGEHLISGILEEDEPAEAGPGHPSGSGATRPASHRQKGGNKKPSTNARAKPKLKSKSTARPRSRLKSRAKK